MRHALAALCRKLVRVLEANSSAVALSVEKEAQLTGDLQLPSILWIGPSKTNGLADAAHPCAADGDTTPHFRGYGEGI